MNKQETLLRVFLPMIVVAISLPGCAPPAINTVNQPIIAQPLKPPSASDIVKNIASQSPVFISPEELREMGLEADVIEWLSKYSSLMPLTLDSDTGEPNPTQSPIFYVEDPDGAYNIAQEAMDYADEQGKPIYWAVGGGAFSSGDEITKLIIENPNAVVIGIDPKSLATPQRTNLSSYQFPPGSFAIAVKARMEDFDFAQGRVDLIEIASPEPVDTKQLIPNAVQLLKPRGSLRVIIREDKEGVGGRFVNGAYTGTYGSYRDFFTDQGWTEENGWSYSETFYSPDELKSVPQLAPRSGHFGYIGGKLIQIRAKEIILTKP